MKQQYFGLIDDDFKEEFCRNTATIIMDIIDDEIVELNGEDYFVEEDYITELLFDNQTNIEKVIEEIPHLVDNMTPEVIEQIKEIVKDHYNSNWKYEED